MMGFTPNLLAADDFVGEVVSLKKSAWVTRNDGAVKSTLQVGDVLYRGDTLEVKTGHSLEVALDESRLNVMHIEGGTVLQIAKSPEKIFDMKSGKVFALLDNPATDRRIKIKTPLAIAAVRGTQYQVSHGETTNILTYQGQVRVSGKDASQSVTLGPNTKSSVDKINQAPSLPAPLSPEEIKEIETIRAIVTETREWLNEWHVASRFSQMTDDKTSDLIESTLEKAVTYSVDDEESQKAQKGKLIY